MQELTHWHPVLLSEELRKKPVSVQLAGQHLVLFRTPSGAVSALLDRCAHRGMRLSCGRVEGERLVCPYHGWRYDTQGYATCPSSPKMKPRALALDASEHQGAVWVRSQGCEQQPLPNLQPEGYTIIGNFREHFDVPVEPLLDNFSEVEHVPTTHYFFGYTLDTLQTMRIEHRSTGDETYTKFVGTTQRPFVARVLEALNGTFGVENLVIEATNRFSPLHVELTVWQADANLEPRGYKLKFFYFFVPRSDASTDLVGFVLWTGISRIAMLLQRRLLLSMAKREVVADKRMIENLVETGPNLKGFALTRFDAAVRENRRLLKAIYRGEDESGPLSDSDSTAQVIPVSRLLG
jgi:vanillate O-demethylase monooxygenase subunit